MKILFDNIILIKEGGGSLEEYVSALFPLSKTPFRFILNYFIQFGFI